MSPASLRGFIAWFELLGLEMTAVGLEAGPLSQWLYAAMIEAKLPAVLLETRQVRDAFRSMPVKTDRKDARGIAQVMRLGWYRRVHCKSQEAQQNRTLLAGRKMLQSRYIDLEMCLRGLLPGYGLKVGAERRPLLLSAIRRPQAGWTRRTASFASAGQTPCGWSSPLHRPSGHVCPYLDGALPADSLPCPVDAPPSRDRSALPSGESMGTSSMLARSYRAAACAKPTRPTPASQALRVLPLRY
jgi:hypothetical protein